jgi:His-Xaa-Ser system protein HxsD
MELEFSSSFYSKKAVEDTVYWLSGRYSLTVDINDDEKFVVKCSNPDESFEASFTKSLNDFNLRATISHETSDIKNLIIAKAFYPEHISVDPIGDFNDPVLMDQQNETE